MIKTLINTGIEREFLSLIKSIYKKPTAFPQSSGTRHEYPLSLLLFNIVLSSHRDNRLEEGRGGTCRLEKKTRNVLLTEGMAVFVQNLKDSIKLVDGWTYRPMERNEEPRTRPTERGPTDFLNQVILLW